VPIPAQPSGDGGRLTDVNAERLQVVKFALPC
jgi:hypothetical protein